MSPDISSLHRLCRDPDAGLPILVWEVHFRGHPNRAGGAYVSLVKRRGRTRAVDSTSPAILAVNHVKADAHMRLSSVPIPHEIIRQHDLLDLLVDILSVQDLSVCQTNKANGGQLRRRN